MNSSLAMVVILQTLSRKDPIARREAVPDFELQIFTRW